MVAAGSDRGNEVMAHVGARLDLPMAANVVEVRDPASGRLVRQRWAGSLLEEATLDAPTRLLTVARTRSRSRTRRPAAGSGGRGVHAELDDATFARVSAAGLEPDRGVSLADARVVVGGGRGVGR